jgi:uncharacterized membrane protein
MTTNKLACKVKYNYTLSIREGEHPLRFKIRSGLLLLDLLVIVLAVVIILSTANILRIILGIPFVLFFPGYTLVLALFPRKEGLSGIERVALSFGLSIAVIPLIGLILNYTPWGIRLESMLYSVTFFIFTMSIIAWLRQRRLPEGERFSIQLTLGRAVLWRGSAWDKVLSIVLALAVLGALGAIGYAIAKPKVGEKFTDFYILGTGGKAADYPQELKLGEQGTVIVGIANHEYETVTYRVEVRIGGVKNSEIAPFSLQPGEKREVLVGFAPQAAGKNQEVEFILYRDGQDEPYLTPLHLWVNVVP